MKPRNCTVPHNPPFSYGDCLRACVATLIDSDDVPHVFDSRPILESWSALREWLRLQGKTLSIFPLDEHAEFMSENNQDIPYILICATMNGNHAVVCRNGKIVHDPSSPQPIKKHSSGFYIVGIIGELS